MSMAGNVVVGFLEDSSMISAILRTVLLYGLFSSLMRYFFPKRFKSLFGALAMEDSEATKSDVLAEADNLATAEKGVGREELRRAFSTFDKNGDGLISKQEMTVSLEKLGLQIGDDELAAAMEKVDANGDGHVDFEEFVMFYESVCGGGGRGGDNLAEDSDLAEAFSVFDGNGDGLITVEELQSVLCSLGLKEGRTAGDCKNMIAKVDMDGDGMVNYAEFKEMMITGFGRKH